MKAEDIFSSVTLGISDPSFLGWYRGNKEIRRLCGDVLVVRFQERQLGEPNRLVLSVVAEIKMGGLIKDGAEAAIKMSRGLFEPVSIICGEGLVLTVSGRDTPANVMSRFNDLLRERASRPTQAPNGDTRLGALAL